MGIDRTDSVVPPADYSDNVLFSTIHVEENQSICLSLFFDNCMVSENRSKTKTL